MNIWEVISVNDLMNILNSSPKQFVIIGIVLESTPIGIQKDIKNFIRQKAKLFLNIKFLFFRGNTKDLSKISWLDNDPNHYPYIYHIFDISNVYIKVNNVNIQTMYESFKHGEEDYNKDLELYLNNKLNPVINPVIKPVNNEILKQQTIILEQREKEFHVGLLKDIQQCKIYEKKDIYINLGYEDIDEQQVLLEKKDKEIKLDEEEIDKLKDELWN